MKLTDKVIAYKHPMMVDENFESFRRELGKMAIQYLYEKSRLFETLEFEISRADAKWPEIQAVMAAHDINKSHTRAEYSQAELHAADYLVMESDWHNGYPMPDDEFRYHELTYDISDYCYECGVGSVQNASFRLKKEPRWGRRSFFCLNWESDALFTRPEVWQNIFEPYGIKNRPVLKYKAETVIENVVQLDITQHTSSCLNVRSLQVEVCPECGRSKYSSKDHHLFHGPYPAFDAPPRHHLFKTNEYFGSGASANQLVIISQDLFGQLAKRKFRGLRFIPMVEDPDDYMRMHLE